MKNTTSVYLLSMRKGTRTAHQTAHDRELIKWHLNSWTSWDAVPKACVIISLDKNLKFFYLQGLVTITKLPHLCEFTQNPCWQIKQQLPAGINPQRIIIS